MDKRKINWNAYRGREDFSLLEAACLLSDIKPFTQRPSKNNDRASDWNLYIDEINSFKIQLRKANIVRTEKKPQKDPYRNIPASNSFLSGYVERPAKTVKTTPLETVLKDELIEFAKKNNHINCYSGLTEAILDKPLQESERKSLQRLVLGMALSKYNFNPDAKTNTATGKSRGSIFDDLEELGLEIDRKTVASHLSKAVEEFWDDNQRVRLKKFKEK